MNAENTARGIVRQEYGNSPNLMTPTVLYYRMVGAHVAVELSQGEGLPSREERSRGEFPTIYGVSFVRLDPETGETRRSYTASNCFCSEATASEYISRVARLLALLGGV